MITVKNHSNQLLWKINERCDHGRFATDRAESIPPGGIDSFGVVSRENSIGTGSRAGSSTTPAAWAKPRGPCIWNVPFWDENTAHHDLAGDEAQLYVATEDEPTGGRDKVRFTFILTGGPHPRPPTRPAAAGPARAAGPAAPRPWTALRATPGVG